MKKAISKYILTFLFLITALNAATTQGNSDVIKILNTAFTNSTVTFQHEKSNQLNNLDYDVPLIEKIELRSETNDFDIRKQDLAIRVSPNTGSSRKAHRLYHESVQYMTKMEYSTEVMKALSERYRMIADYVYAKELLSVENVKNVVAKDKVKLLKKMVSLSSFDIVELIEAEDEIYKLQRKIQNINNRIENLHAQLCSLISCEELNIDKNDIISIQEIKSLLNFNSIPEEKNHPEVEVLSAKHYNAMMEHEWESAKNNFSIGFIQASYGHDPGNPFRSNFSLGFGFDFPMKGSSRLDLNEIKLKILDTQSEYLEVQEQIAQNQMISTSKLKSLISMHDLLSNQIEEGNADHALAEYSRQGVASPRAILKLKELTVNNEALLIEIETEITTTYLDYIYSTGMIGNTPYKNYLDGNLSILQ